MGVGPQLCRSFVAAEMRVVIGIIIAAIRARIEILFIMFFLYIVVFTVGTRAPNRVAGFDHTFHTF